MTIKLNETKLKEIKLKKHESTGNYNNIYKEETNKGFRLSRKHLFLTYSQTDITPEECYHQLAIKLGKWQNRRSCHSTRKNIRLRSKGITRLKKNQEHISIVT